MLIKRGLCVPSLFLLFSLVAASSQAAVLQVYDFEDPALHATQWSVVTVPGDNAWTANGVNETAVIPSGYSTASIQGDRIIRTWNRGLGNPADVIFDGPTGGIRTAPWTLANNATFDYLIGGGNHAWPGAGDPDAIPANVAVLNLEAEVGAGDWEVLFTATGPNANSVHAESWDASAHAGKTVRLAIYDTTSGGWGHVDIDNIVYSGDDPIPEPGSIVLLALGALSFMALGWSRRKKRA
jgi:hypothetical protein